MEYVKIISLLPRLESAENAVALERAGVDELYYILEREQDLEMIKDISAAVDIPLTVRMSPQRFEDVKKVLYAGASSVCLQTEKEELIEEVLGRFGAEKIFGMINGSSVDNIRTEAERMSAFGYGRLYLETEPDLCAWESVAQTEIATVQPPVILRQVERITDVHALGAVIRRTAASGIVLPAADGMLAMQIKQGLREDGISVHTFTSAIPFSDFRLNGDGLIPVVVQDYKSGEVLMLAYMNEEAFAQTLESGQMTYYSRSRRELWRKGATSGHYQYVKELRLDCDNDTILAKVEQIGAACHTGNYTCFFQELAAKEYNDTNPLTILQEDYAVIAQRKQQPKEGSYTNYLFDKGIDKILKKVGEEATEIVIAAKNPDTEELKYEISDFLYHMMVLMVERGLTWEDITRELTERR